MTDISKEAVSALLQGVTEGPWHVGRGDGQWFVGGGGFARVDMTGPLGDHEANARFIAAARELVPAQTDKIEAQAAEIATLRAALDEAEDRIRKICLDALISYGQVEARANDYYERWNDCQDKRMKAEAERDAANALLREYADTFCEGFCEDFGPNTQFDCSGCKARAHLGAKP